MRPTVERAGLAPLDFHELRHTAAALMIDSGADVLAVSRRLGHEGVSTTLNLYGHRFPQRDDELTKRRDERRALAVLPRPGDAPQAAVIDTRLACGSASDGGSRWS